MKGSSYLLVRMHHCATDDPIGHGSWPASGIASTRGMGNVRQIDICSRWKIRQTIILSYKSVICITIRKPPWTHKHEY